MSDGHRSSRGHGDDHVRINFTALLLAGFVAFCFAAAQGEAPVPDLRNGVVDPVYLDDEPAPPADPGPTCSAEDAAAIIVASGLSVADWQTQAGIVSDGVIGPQTIAAACP
jgi:hypothetical protein